MHHWDFVPPLPHSDYIVDVSVKLGKLGLCGHACWLARWPVMPLVGLGRDSGGIRAKFIRYGTNPVLDQALT